MLRPHSHVHLVVALAFALSGCTLFTADASPPSAQPTASSGGGSVGAETVPRDGVGASPGAYGSFTLRQREFIDEQNAEFQERVDVLTERCGFTVPSQINWESFRAEIDRRLDGDLNVTFAGFCVLFVDDIGELCRDRPAASSAIQQRIQGYECLFGGPGGRASSIDGGVLRYAVDWDATNNDAFADDFLGRSL